MTALIGHGHSTCTWPHLCRHQRSLNRDLELIFLIVQRSPPEHVASLLMAVDPQSAERIRQIAAFGPAHIQKANVVTNLNYVDRCYPTRSSLQCLVWQGETEIPEGVQFRNRHGLLFLLVHHSWPPSDDIATSTVWDEEEEEGLNLLQTRQVLHLGNLITQTIAVRLLNGSHYTMLPDPVEVPVPAAAHEVQAELRNWGYERAVHHCAPHGNFLCLGQELQHDDEFLHYVFCHDYCADLDGCFLHSPPEALQEFQLMRLLCMSTGISEGCRPILYLDAT